MKKIFVWTAVINLLLLLAYFNYSIIKNEELLKDGQLILLELAPVDPRSLMQGDYMTLRYAMSTNLPIDSLAKRGYCILALDSLNRATRVRLQTKSTPLGKYEFAIAYTAPNHWNLNIGAESYFFQEGHAKKYEKAKYGGLKIDKEGNSLLVGLYDQDLRKIE